MHKNGFKKDLPALPPSEVARAISEFWKTHAQINFKFNDLRYNDIPCKTINIRLPSKRYSKVNASEPQCNDLRCSKTSRKIFPVIRIKSMSLTTGNSNIIYATKQTFFTLTKIINNVSGNSHARSFYAPVADVNWCILSGFICLIFLVLQ